MGGDRSGRSAKSGPAGGTRDALGSGNGGRRTIRFLSGKPQHNGLKMKPVDFHLKDLEALYIAWKAVLKSNSSC